MTKTDRINLILKSLKAHTPVPYLTMGGHWEKMTKELLLGEVSDLDIVPIDLAKTTMIALVEWAGMVRKNYAGPTYFNSEKVTAARKITTENPFWDNAAQSWWNNQLATLAPDMAFELIPSAVRGDLWGLVDKLLDVCAKTPQEHQKVLSHRFPLLGEAPDLFWPALLQARRRAVAWKVIAGADHITHLNATIDQVHARCFGLLTPQDFQAPKFHPTMWDANHSDLNEILARNLMTPEQVLDTLRPGFKPSYATLSTSPKHLVGKILWEHIKKQNLGQTGELLARLDKENPKALDYFSEEPDAIVRYPVADTNHPHHLWPARLVVLINALCDQYSNTARQTTIPDLTVAQDWNHETGSGFRVGSYFMLASMVTSPSYFKTRNPNDVMWAAGDPERMWKDIHALLDQWLPDPQYSFLMKKVIVTMVAAPFWQAQDKSQQMRLMDHLQNWIQQEDSQKFRTITSPPHKIMAKEEEKSYSNERRLVSQAWGAEARLAFRFHENQDDVHVTPDRARMWVDLLKIKIVSAVSGLLHGLKKAIEKGLVELTEEDRQIISSRIDPPAEHLWLSVVVAGASAQKPAKTPKKM